MKHFWCLVSAQEGPSHSLLHTSVFGGNPSILEELHQKKLFSYNINQLVVTVDTIRDRNLMQTETTRIFYKYWNSEE